MKKRYFIEIESDRDDEKLVDETGEEYTEEEAIKTVRDDWSNTFQGYYSWRLKPILFKYSDKYED